MLKQDPLAGFDSVKINARAIASIAYIAAIEVEGVKSTAKDFRSILTDLLGFKHQNGIRIKFDKNNDVKIKVSVIVKYGFNIPEIAAKIQENVYKAMEKMAGISVKDIDINIRQVEK